MSGFKVLIVASCLVFSGCATLLGSVKPTEEKSDLYRVMKLNREHPEWVLLEPDKTFHLEEKEEEEETKTSDVSYQSQKTGAIISLNSACTPRNATTDHSLEAVTDLLFLGVTNIAGRQRRSIAVDQKPALQTTLRGNVGSKRMKLRAIVLRHGECLYDFMYISRPKLFASEEAVFNEFVTSFRSR